MFIAQAYALWGWVKSGDGPLLRRNLIAQISAVLIAGVVILLILLSFDISFIPGFVYVHSSRIIFILAGLATMATIIAHVSGLRRDYATALQNEVDAARREAEINRELFEAEQRYASVKALAGRRQRQLAAASHDLRQPLTSLRSTIDAMMHDKPAEMKDQLRNAFDYLENLCTGYLRDTRDTADDEQLAESKVHEHSDVVHESLDLSLLLKTIHRMFEQEARNKTIELTVSPASVIIEQPPTVLMRIISNLMSNAIKHSDGGSVTLSVHSEPGQVSIEVADEGAGISASMMQHIMLAYAKGPDSSGEGLGLAICKQLAEQHGMQLLIESEAGHGTRCTVLIPAQS